MQLDICINRCIFTLTLQVLVKGFAGNFLRKVHPSGFIAAIFFALQQYYNAAIFIFQVFDLQDFKKIKPVLWRDFPLENWFFVDGFFAGLIILYYITGL